MRGGSAPPASLPVPVPTDSPEFWSPGESDGFNIPEVRACPEVGAYLEMSPSELAQQVPRDMRGVARRLLCDAYMYLYQSGSMCLYR